jgi:hypothetical protein
MASRAATMRALWWRFRLIPVVALVVIREGGF